MFYVSFERSELEHNKDVLPYNMLRYTLSLDKNAECFYFVSFLELIEFSVSTRLLWIRVSLQSGLLLKHKKALCSSISQSNCCIFYKTTESVNIYELSHRCWQLWNYTSRCTVDTRRQHMFPDSPISPQHCSISYHLDWKCHYILQGMFR